MNETNLPITTENHHTLKVVLLVSGIIIILVAVGLIFWWQRGGIGAATISPITAPTAVVEKPVKQEVDTDSDRLSDAAEAKLGTDPKKADTDNDGLTDAEEVHLKTDPLNPHSLRADMLDGDAMRAQAKKIIFGQ